MNANSQRDAGPTMIATESYWEALPIFVNDEPRWALVKHHTVDGKRYRDRHGNFTSLAAVNAAIDHLESAPVRFTAKGEA